MTDEQTTPQSSTQADPAVGTLIVNELRALPAEVLERVKDVDLVQYPREALDKLKSLDWSGYSHDVVDQLKKLGNFSGDVVGSLRKLVQSPAAADPAAQKKVYQLQMKAIDSHASDLFLSSGSLPSLRIDGKTIFLKDEAPVDTQMLKAYLAGAMSDYHRQKLAENLEHDFSLSVEGGYRFRVNVFLQRNGISMTFRTIPQRIPTFDELKLPEVLKSISDMPSGLVLVTGSTGSGKSTTLASIIDLINERYQKHIITIEDPIEFAHQNKQSLVEQREIGVHSKSFANSLRSALREAPDVILVGEMRDAETISLALTAAETGSLVLGTLHSNGAPNAINRIIDTFPAAQQDQIRMQLSESLRAVVWQTLLPRVGGSGRITAFEVLWRTSGVANLIRENKTFQLKNEITTGQGQGMIELKAYLEGLLAQGEISQEVAQEVFSHHV